MINLFIILPIIIDEFVVELNILFMEWFKLEFIAWYKLMYNIAWIPITIVMTS